MDDDTATKMVRSGATGPRVAAHFMHAARIYSVEQPKKRKSEKAKPRNMLPLLPLPGKATHVKPVSIAGQDRALATELSYVWASVSGDYI